jgi:hypothetical protein
MAIAPTTSLVSRANYLPRLAPVFYQADAVVHWELSVSHRRTGWLTPALHYAFREIMVHAGTRHGLLCPVYCLMPDHFHMVWMGLRLEANQLHAMAFVRTYLGPLLAPAELQHQAYDHVLRDQERRRNAFAATCGYVLANPVQAGLVARPEEYPFSGANVPGYPRWHPCDKRFWARFWALYAKTKDPAASMIKRPADRLPGVPSIHP